VSQALDKNPDLQISPLVSLVDEDVAISVNGLNPNEKVCLICQTCDEEGMVWRSTAIFVADEKGTVCLERQAPLEGNYQGIDQMGLFWSMRPVNGSQACFFSAKKRDPMSFEITVECESKKSVSKILTRLKIAEGIERMEVREEGLVGVYFFPKGKQNIPALIILGGSEGGIKEPRGALLASRGFATLTLAYFGVVGLPKQLKGISIEYVQKGAEWLKARQEIDPKKVGLLGSSRGAELALIAASFFPGTFQALVAYVPSCAIYGGLPDIHSDAWLYQGKPIAPPAPFPLEESQEEIGDFEHPVACTPYFLQGMQEGSFSDSLIPVERIDCPLLLISGDRDAMWPSSTFSDLMMEKLQKAHSGIWREHLCYSGAGHFIAIPNFPTTNQVIFHPALLAWLNFGGEPQAQARSCRDSWKETIQFLKRFLYNF